MSEKIIALLVWLIGSGVRGYASVVLLMAVQSACIPIPSEVIMPLAGAALVTTLGMTAMQVQMQLFLLATVASLASNLGSVPAYWAGARGGRPMVERYGRWVLLSRRDLDGWTTSLRAMGRLPCWWGGCYRSYGRLSRFRRAWPR